MNASMESLLPSGSVVPFFQPIVSLQTMKVIGYEALGRVWENEQARSLGPFFQNRAIAEELLLSVDRQIREQAIRSMATAQTEGWLFLNIKPSWIARAMREKGELPTLGLLDNYGLPGSRVVVEITEEAFAGKLQDLSEVLGRYRERRVRIAVDDVGSAFSSLDRIAMIRPDIIKMDLNILKKSAVYDGYKALLRSFSIIAAQMGASLLIEGVETKDDLQNALHAGARYVQGFLFSQAVPELMPEERFAPLLEEETERFGQAVYTRYDRLLNAGAWLQRMELAAGELGGEEDAERFVEGLLPSVSKDALRLYVCREDGRQVSANFTRAADGGWRKEERFRGSNWIWRPYFIPNIVMMKKRRTGILSETYVDLETAHYIQTYSCPVGGGFYLFVDLMV